MIINRLRLVKARHTGNFNVFTIPKSFKINKDKPYLVFQGRHGSIIYSPMNRNIFKDPKYKHVDFSQRELGIGSLKKREDPDE